MIASVSAGVVESVAFVQLVLGVGSHAEIQTTSPYLAELADDGATVGDVDRHHDGLRRRRLAA